MTRFAGAAAAVRAFDAVMIVLIWHEYRTLRTGASPHEWPFDDMA